MFCKPILAIDILLCCLWGCSHTPPFDIQIHGISLLWNAQVCAAFTREQNSTAKPCGDRWCWFYPRWTGCLVTNCTPWALQDCSWRHWQQEKRRQLLLLIFLLIFWVIFLAHFTSASPLNAPILHRTLATCHTSAPHRFSPALLCYSGTRRAPSPPSLMLSYLCRSFGNEYKAIIINEEAIQNLWRWKRSHIRDGTAVASAARCCLQPRPWHCHASPLPSANTAFGPLIFPFLLQFWGI